MERRRKYDREFKIDHPLDPANKYLQHSFVESPDMKNIYDGVVALDKEGSATVAMPDWFDALNRDFRYQLTPMGAAMPNLHIVSEINGRTFVIAGGKPGMKVSWQVTGIRQDEYARAHPIEVEVDKVLHERNRYMHPELYGLDKSKSVGPVGEVNEIESQKRAAAVTKVNAQPAPRVEPDRPVLKALNPDEN